MDLTPIMWLVHPIFLAALLAGPWIALQPLVCIPIVAYLILSGLVRLFEDRLTDILPSSRQVKVRAVNWVASFISTTILGLAFGIMIFMIMTPILVPGSGWPSLENWLYASKIILFSTAVVVFLMMALIQIPIVNWFLDCSKALTYFFQGLIFFRAYTYFYWQEPKLKTLFVGQYYPSILHVAVFLGLSCVTLFILTMMIQFATQFVPLFGRRLNNMVQSVADLLAALIPLFMYITFVRLTLQAG